MHVGSGATRLVVPGLADDEEVGDEFGVDVDGVLVEQVPEQERVCGAELGADEALEAMLADGELGVRLLQVIGHVLDAGKPVASTAEAAHNRTQKLDVVCALAATRTQLAVADHDVIILETAAFEEVEKLRCCLGNRQSDLPASRIPTEGHDGDVVVLVAAIGVLANISK